MVLAACHPSSQGTSGGGPPNGSSDPTTNAGGGAAGGAPVLLGSTQLPGRWLLENVDLDHQERFQSYIVDLKTGDRRVLPVQSTDNTESDSWTTSDDGKQLVVWNDGKRNLTFFDSNTLASGASWHLDANDYRDFYEPVPSRDGKYILAITEEGIDGQNITVLDVAHQTEVKHGSKLDDGYPDGREYAWLPDGRYIYLMDRSIYVTSVEADPEQATRLFDMPALPDNGLGSTTSAELAVSPDGKRLALAWPTPRDGSMDSILWVVDMDGKNLHRLIVPADPKDVLGFSVGDPTWSPDGQSIAAMHFMGGGVVTAPTTNDDPNFGGDRVIGASGCNDVVVVFSPDDHDVAVPNKDVDPKQSVKIHGASGDVWAGTCGGRVAWLP
jgi:Tol biopolymer transport system component